MKTKTGYSSSLFFTLTVSIIISLVFGVFSFIYYNFYRINLQEDAKKELSTYADFKEREILDWYDQRRSAASIISSSPYITDLINEELTKGLSPERYELLKRRLGEFKEYNKFFDVLLIDSDYKIVLTFTEDTIFSLPDASHFLKQAEILDTIVFTDFYLCNYHKRIHLDICIPYKIKKSPANNEGVGFLILRIDPKRYLYPLIQRWPVASKTAETVLGRVEGDSVVFLNELRHKKNTAMVFKFSLEENDLPLVKAGKGKRGVIEGFDYRGERVTADVRSIEPLKWLMVNKIDNRELYSAVNTLLVKIVLVDIAFLILIWSGFFILRLIAMKENEKRLIIANAANESMRRNYDKILSSINDVIITVDKDLNIVNANLKASEVYGYASKELIGKNMREVAKYRKEAEDKYGVNGNEGIAFKDVHTAKDGREIDVEVSSGNIELNGTEYRQFIVRDVTERKKYEDMIQEQNEELRAANEELTASEEEIEAGADELRNRLAEIEEKTRRIEEEKEFSQLILNMLPAMFIAMTPEGKIVQMNRYMEKLTGYSSEEVLNRDYFDIFIDSDEKESVKHVFSLLLSKDSSSVHENRLKCRNGSILDINWYNASLKDDDGAVNYVFAIGVDVTARKRLEAELAVSIERSSLLGSILDNSNQPFGIGYPDGRLGLVNKAFCEMTGYSEKELERMDWINELTPKEWRDIEKKQLEELLKNGGPVQYEKEYLRKDGKKIPIELLVQLVKDENGSPLYYYSFVTELTHRKKLENEIFQMRKMESVGQLAGGIAHDFNNMLAGITGNAELLERMFENNSEVLKYVENISKSAFRAARLTDQLLSFARKGVFQFRKFNICDIISDTIEILSSTIDKRIFIKKECESNEIYIEGDSSQIENMLLNLGLNARDAMPAGGEIVFSVSIAENSETSRIGKTGEKDLIRLSVRDTGCGMEDDVKEHMFEPFFTTKEVGKGTGLGLASVYGIVKEHEGVIEVLSEVGRGTEIVVYLPRVISSGSETAEKANSRIEDEQCGGGGEMVIVVDDEDVVRNLAYEMLTRSGYNVKAFSSGREALEYFREHFKEVKAVLLDMIMPEMNGIDLFRKMKDIDENVKAVFSSGYGANDESLSSIIRESVCMVSKPYRMRELLEAVAKAVNEGK